MRWKVILTEKATKQFRKLPETLKRRVLDYLHDVEGWVDPRMRGKALVGKQPRWRYRVGDYRIVCEIRENELLITVIAIDHRKDVYR